MNVYLADTTQKIVTETAKVVKNLIKNGQKCVVFSEDKITLSLELEIASLLGGGFFDVEVITFKRYVSEKNTTAKVISKESSVMIIRKIISDLKDKLSCFKNSLLTPNMALTLYELISQLESAKVTPNELKRLIDGDGDLTVALKNKIKDLYIVYDQYKREIKSKNLYDGNDYLSLMPSICLNDKEIKDKAVIISGFQSVTKQRYDVFEALYKSAKSFYAVIPYDKNSNLYTGEVYEKLKSICKAPNVIDCCGGLPVEAEFIKGNFLDPKVFSEKFVPLKTDNVSLYEAEDKSDECEWLAKDVSQLIRTQNLRFKDISVAVGDLDSCLPFINKFFNDYDIPFFVEKTTTLYEHPVCDLIVSVLDFQRKGYSVADYVKIITSSLIILDKETADGYVNYLYKNMINRKAFKVPFTKEDANLEKYEQIRRLVISIADNLQSAKTVCEFVSAIKRFIEKSNLEENLNELTVKLKSFNYPTLSNFNDKILDKVSAVLDEMNGVLKDTKISALDFKNVFLSGAIGTKISSIPILNDAVYVGEIKETKMKSAKVLYAVSLNGDLPFTKSDTALLTDGDLKVLDGFEVIIEPKIKAVNEREKENVAITLCSFTEKLKLSYSVLDATGSQAFKSDALKHLIKMFNLKPRSKINKGFIDEVDIKDYINEVSKGFVNENTSLIEIAKSYVGYKNSDFKTNSKIASFITATERLNYLDLKDKAVKLLSEKSQEKFIKSGENASIKGGEITASVLESYFSCPYKNYAQNVLKLKETPVLEVRANETGTLLHLVTEKYVKQIDKINDKISSDVIVNQIFEEIKSNKDYEKYLSSPKLEYTMSRLLKECKRVCFNIFSSLTNSDFKPKYFEVKFGEGQSVPAIKLHTKNGVKGVKGVVDRVDEYNNYVRIIDYKSGRINDSDEYFYTGNKLQLYLYMNAFTKDKKPAGVYYYPVKDDYTDKEENYVMRGKTLLNGEILTATDKNLTAGATSKIVSVNRVKDGSVSKRSAVLSEEDMNKYLKYAIKLSKNCIDEISTGYLTPSPYENACTYCSYGGMCGFCEYEGGKFRKVNSVDCFTITHAVDLDEKLTNKAENDNE